MLEATRVANALRAGADELDALATHAYSYEVGTLRRKVPGDRARDGRGSGWRGRGTVTAGYAVDIPRVEMARFKKGPSWGLTPRRSVDAGRGVRPRHTAV
jgi:hypothetical protein